MLKRSPNTFIHSDMCARACARFLIMCLFNVCLFTSKVRVGGIWELVCAGVAAGLILAPAHGHNTAQPHPPHTHTHTHTPKSGFRSSRYGQLPRRWRDPSHGRRRAEPRGHSEASRRIHQRNTANTSANIKTRAQALSHAQTTTH